MAYGFIWPGFQCRFLVIILVLLLYPIFVSLSYFVILCFYFYQFLFSIFYNFMLVQFRLWNRNILLLSHWVSISMCSYRSHVYVFCTDYILHITYCRFHSFCKPFSMQFLCYTKQMLTYVVTNNNVHEGRHHQFSEDSFYLYWLQSY